MRQFVGHQRDQALVAGDDRRGGERQARIFHAAEGKAGRQHQQVVAAPAVRAVKLFDRADHGLRIFEFARGGIHDGGLGIHAGARPDRAEGQVARGQRDEIGRHRLLHAEAAVTQHLGPHDGAQAFGGADLRRERDAHSRGILQRDPTARMDGLRLGEKERVPPPRGLRRLQPLQSGGARRRGIADGHTIRAFRRADAQGRAQYGIGGAQLEGRGVVDCVDREVPRVEY